MPSLLTDHSTALSLARHTPGPATAPDTALPSPAADNLASADLSSIAPADARVLSKTLFARLDALEEGTAEYSYVRNTLVELNLALVHFAARQFHSRTESAEDVLQVGTIGLIKAINRFDPSHGVEFVTFALPTIFGEIKRFFRDTTWALRVPRRLKELRLTLDKATADLEQCLGRPPTVAELSTHLHLDAEEVLEGLGAANSYNTLSLDAPFEGTDRDDALADHVGFEDHDLELVEELTTLQPVIAALPERDRKILAIRFGREMTQREIADELGVSQMHVSRLLARILAKLRSHLTPQ
ncbi:RNA polymerase sigma factor SigF [Streptomyces incarnatus]|uniref:RNA polymerase sigma factor SigF n=1 Tax=Streptomyces incarnatus TaxID=665007 RepID=UPI000A72417C|nr:RNA polymerase sigma factor SigF [Streptomyces incarnatus]